MKDLLIAKGSQKKQSGRPGWIPNQVGNQWDTSPFAYQTEEEAMPAGGLHGYFLSYILELLRHLLEKQGQMLLLDVFLLYSDGEGTKIAPDLILTPHQFPPASTWNIWIMLRRPIWSLK